MGRFGWRRARRSGWRGLGALASSGAGDRSAADRKGGLAATLTALKPPKRERPLIAIFGINDATEVTDYLMPYGILRRADVADVVRWPRSRGR